jgi:hypothetical protein
MRIGDDQLKRYDELSEELSGFEDGEEVVDFILTRVAEELESNSSIEGTSETDSEVEQRLQDLGYME